MINRRWLFIAMILFCGSSFGNTVKNLSLIASTPDNYESDDLTSIYTLAGAARTAATAWYRNGEPLMSLYLPFEGGEATALLDYSGNFSNAAVGAGVVWSASGGHDGNGAYLFDGSAAAAIDAGDSMPAGAYTKAAWVRRTGTGWNNIISGDANHVFWAPDTYSYRLSAGHNGNWNIVQDSVPLELDSWHLVAVTYDPNSNAGEMVLYRDGQEVDRTINVASVSPDPRVWVGAYAGGDNWGGALDDVRLYAQALSAEQIAALYYNGQNHIAYTETRAGDAWQVHVTPFTSKKAGETAVSNVLTIQTSSVVLELLEIAGPVNVDESATATYDATAHYSDGSSAPVAAESWGVDCPSFAAITGGVLTTNAVDTDTSCTVSASYTQEGVTVSDNHAILIVDIPPPVVLELLEIAGPVNVDESATATYDATAHYSDGSSAPVAAESWGVDCPSFAAITGGVLTTNAVDADTSCTVSASYTQEGVTVSDNHAILIVDIPPPVVLELLEIAGPANVDESATATYDATAHYSDGSSAPVAAESWGVDCPSFAAITGGVLTTNAVDADTSCTVSASYTQEGVTVSDNHAILIVDIPPPVVLELLEIAGPVNVDESATATYDATAHYSDGSSAPVAAESWGVDCPSFAAITGGVLTTNAVDADTSCTVSASYTQEGVTVSDNHAILIVDIPPPVVLELLEIAGPANVDESATATYDATAHYSDGSSAPVAAESWGVDCPLFAAITGGVLTTNAVDTDTSCTVSASYTQEGVTVSDNHAILIVDIPPPVVLELLEIAGPANVDESATATYDATAHYSDGSSAPVAAESWGVDCPSFAAITGGVLTTNAVDADTSCTVSASYTQEGVTVSDNHAILIVDIPPPVVLELLEIAGPANVDESATAAYDATAHYSDGSSAPVAAESWGVDCPSFAAITGGVLTTNAVDADTSCTVSASYTQEGVTVSDNHAILIVDTPVVLELLEIAGPANVDESATAAYDATAHYSDGSSAPVAAESWGVDCPSFAAITGGVLTTNAVDADTSCTVSASYTQEGVTVSDNHAILIVDVSSLAPRIIDLSLIASTPDNNESDDLTSIYTLAGTATTAATAWYRNGEPLMSLYLPFEGGEATAPLDYSGNLSNAAVEAGVVWSASGGHDGNGAYLFDGSAAIDAGDSMPVSAYTKAAWVRRTTSGSNNILSGNANHAFWAPSTYSFRLSAGHNGNWYIVQDSVPLELDSWYLVAVTYDPNSNGGEMVLYRDGQEVDRTINVVPVSLDPGVWVGAFAGGNRWRGALDDVRLYAQALSAEQIAALYYNGQNHIAYTETRAGDAWQVHVTPFSSSRAGATAVSNVLAIQASSVLLELLEIAGPANVDESATAAYDATAHYSDGSSAPVAAESWGVDCPSFAAITGGVLTTNAVDTDTSCTVSASYTQGGVTVSDNHAILIVDTPVVLELLEIAGPANVDESATATYDATAHYSDGSSAPVAAESWGVDCPSFAAITGGVLTTNAVDADTSCTVSASYTQEGVTVSDNHAILIVDTPPPVVLELLEIAGPANVDESATATYDATAHYSDGSSAPVAAESWGVDCPLFAAITGGVLTTNAVDTDTSCTVSASYTQEGVTVSDNHVILIVDVSSLAPRIIDLSLIASTPDNNESDDLTSIYTLAGTATTAATAWYRNGEPLMSLYLPFEGGEATAPLDYSGNLSNAAVEAGVVWSASGGHDGNGAYLFDGSAAIDAGDSMPVSAYTKAAWVRRTTSGSNNILSGNANHAFWAPSTYSFRLSAGHNGNWYIVQDSVPLELGSWYLVAVTYDPNSNGGEMVLYRDGQEVDRTINVVPVSLDPGVWVGAFAGGYRWRGALDDVRLYAQALSAEQIAALYYNDQNHIAYTETRAGDAWQVHVTPFSSSRVGATAVSNVLTIQASPVVLDRLEIAGPVNVDESATATYDATAHYSDGSSAPVAAESWGVDCPSFAAITGGVLTTNAVDADTSCTVSASYTQGGVTVSDNHAILIVDGLPSEPVIRIMPLGDSITYGLLSFDIAGYRSYLYRSLQNSGYVIDFVGSRRTGPSDIDRDHEGHSGWMANDIRDNIYTWLVTTPTDIVLLHIGTNDINDGQTVTDVAAEIDEILDNIRQYDIDYSHTTTIFLAQIINSIDPTNITGIRMSALNQEILTMVNTRQQNGESIFVVDHESALIYPDDLIDTLHPNDYGYQKMADAWFDAILTFYQN